MERKRGMEEEMVEEVRVDGNVSERRRNNLIIR